ncbi:MAG: hypothetical protein K6G17_08010 [Oscillospiraceae bacterium]|nr:hypothetical protein [Oscillospiraceae bacterium]
MKDKGWLKKLEAVKFPLLILALGLLLMLIPGRSADEPEISGDQELREILRSSRGVGEVYVLSSEHGVVVVCEGAENADVKLDILRAVGSYTGFGSDAITILKLADH